MGVRTGSGTQAGVCEPGEEFTLKFLLGSAPGFRIEKHTFSKFIMKYSQPVRDFEQKFCWALNPMRSPPKKKFASPFW